MTDTALTCEYVVFKFVNESPRTSLTLNNHEVKVELYFKK